VCNVHADRGRPDVPDQYQAEHQQLYGGHQLSLWRLQLRRLLISAKPPILNWADFASGPFSLSIWQKADDTEMEPRRLSLAYSARSVLRDSEKLSWLDLFYERDSASRQRNEGPAHRGTVRVNARRRSGSGPNAILHPAYTKRAHCAHAPKI